MVSLTGTLTAVSVVTGGLFALCASVFATAGWTAPACLASGFSSGVLLVLGIVNDASGQTSQNGNDPDSKRSIGNTWYRIHDNGFMENYDGKINSLWGTNDTVTMLDVNSGYAHEVKMKGEHVHVKTHFTQNNNQRRQAQSQSIRNRRRGVAGLASLARSPETTSRQLSSAVYFAQKTDTIEGGDTQANANAIGSAIANQAYELGSWCVSINDGSNVVADIGLTLGGTTNPISEDEPPCEATAKKKRL